MVGWQSWQKARLTSVVLLIFMQLGSVYVYLYSMWCVVCSYAWTCSCFCISQWTEAWMQSANWILSKFIHVIIQITYSGRWHVFKSHLLYLHANSCTAPQDSILIFFFSKFTAAQWDILFILLSSPLCPDIFTLFFSLTTGQSHLAPVTFTEPGTDRRLKSCSAGLLSYRMSLWSSAAPRILLLKDLNARYFQTSSHHSSLMSQGVLK